MDSGEDAVIRSTGFDGIKVGKIKSVGFDRFQIQEADGAMASIKIDSLLDIN
jgi:hypothetical protein